MLDAAHIPHLHDLATAHGHDPAAPVSQPANALEQLILDQHSANFDLWHCEDQARDPLGTDATLAATKRSIDRLNQLRNDLSEQIDQTLLQSLTTPPADTVPQHSETPGLMIDRLSILALKIFHTAEQLNRSTPEHQQRNRQRLAVLNEQREDLTLCLVQLWDDVLSGRRRFKLYRQLKMYNDPTLNPVLYSNAPKG
jgi:hypothetical protein